MKPSKPAYPVRGVARSVPAAPITFWHASRKAALRGAVFGVALVLPVAFIAIALDDWRARSALAAALGAFLCGALSGPTWIVELLATRWPASAKRELAVGVITALVAAVGLGAGFAQTVFTYVLIEQGSMNAALESANRIAREVLTLEGPFLIVASFAPFALPFVSVASSRLRRRTTFQGLRFALVTGLIAAVPTFLVATGAYRVRLEVVVACLLYGGGNALASLVLGWSSDLAEHLDARIEAASA